MPPERLAEIQSQSSGVGIRGMRERLQQFNGTIDIQSDRSGTRIVFTIPLEQDSRQNGGVPVEASKVAV
jgi:signal transduction histidine kinase